MSSPADAQEAKPEPLVGQVQKAIDQGVKYLRSQQRGTGSWDIDVGAIAVPAGWTTLTLLALLNAGVPPNDPAIERGLKYLRALESRMTYAGIAYLIRCRKPA